MTTPQTRPLDRFAWAVLVAALLLRVAVMLAVFNSAEPFSGDGPYYIKNAQQPWRLGVPPPDWPYAETSAYTTSIGPVYPVFLMSFYNLIPGSAPVVQAVSTRVAQAVLDTLIVLLVYLLTGHLFGRPAARVALVAQALDLRYVFTAGAIATETLFLALFIAGMLVYLRAAVPPHAGERMGPFRLAGLLLGLATLTRPVPLLFPAVLLVHALLAPRAPGGDRSLRARYWRGLAWTVGVMALVVVPWLVRTSYVKGEFVPISDTGAVHFWRATREDGEVISTDEAHAQAAAEDMGYDLEAPAASTTAEDYVGAGVRRIQESPARWLGGIAADTAGSLLQPYGTVIATPRGAGVRQAVAAWLRGDGAFREVLAVPALWRRLLMYIWHYWGLIAGLVGALLAARRRWWDLLPLAGWAAYVVAAAAVLLVEPRYLFPAMFVLTVLAAHATAEGWRWLASRGRLPRWLQAGAPTA